MSKIKDAFLDFWRMLGSQTIRNILLALIAFALFLPYLKPHIEPFQKMIKPVDLVYVMGGEVSADISDPSLNVNITNGELDVNVTNSELDIEVTNKVKIDDTWPVEVKIKEIDYSLR